MNELDELINFLYQNRQRTDYPQLVLGKTKQSKKIWLPGKYRKNRMSKSDVESFPMVGLTGKTYGSYTFPMDSQGFKLFWIGLDIDDCQDLEKIKSSCPNSSIRLSTSGTGYHVIFRLDRAYSFSKGTNVNGVIKYNLNSYIEKLKENSIEVCSISGSKCFFMTGGSQSWLYKNETDTIPLKFSFAAEPSRISPSYQSISIDLLNDLGKEFFQLLFDKKIIQPTNQIPTKFNIYIKHFYEALKETKFEFQTKSPMKSTEPHFNGFIFIRGYNLNIFGNADNKVVLSFECREEVRNG